MTDWLSDNFKKNSAGSFGAQQGTKWASKAWPKMTNNTIFGQNFSVLGQKILIFMVGIKSFGNHITENHLDTMLHMGPEDPSIRKKYP